MSDESGGTGWDAPGDALADSRGAAREDGSADAEGPLPVFTMSSNEDDPPPPPPPADARTTYGASGWEPPKTPRRIWLTVGILVGLVAVTVIVVWTAVYVTQIGDATTTLTQEQGQSLDTVPGDVPADLAAQTAAVLQTIDASEQRMITYQQDVTAALNPDDTVGDAAPRISELAQATGNDLTDLRSRLTDLAAGGGDEFDGLRAVRDSYAMHMSAWIAYVDAVGATPTLAVQGAGDASSYLEDIGTSGEVFVTAVDRDLPDQIPANLQELADMIVERGFGGYDPGPSGNVV